MPVDVLEIVRLPYLEKETFKAYAEQIAPLVKMGFTYDELALVVYRLGRPQVLPVTI